MISTIDFSKIKTTDRMVEFTDKAPAYLVGKRLPILSEPHFIRYDAKLNLGSDINSVVICDAFDEQDYNDFNGTTLNKLTDLGVIKDWQPYTELRWMPEEDIYPDELYDQYGAEGVKDAIDDYVAQAVEFFQENTYNVTEKAVRHQIEAWYKDYKSGYRDQKNGYHLFTPCGHNPLSINLTTLHKLAADWQKTYEW